MSEHQNLVSLSGAFLAESAYGNFLNVKQVVELVSDDEINYFIGHLSFEIHQFILEMFTDDNNNKKCFEYFQNKQKQGKLEDMV